VHRDLKPANVLLATPPSAAGPPPPVVALLGVPKVSDFGLAKRLGEEGGHTKSDAVMGTPGYMAPEQAEGRSKYVGPAADVYSLGAILYECLTGQPPFRGQTMMETLDQVRNREPASPRKLCPDVPRDLETICLRALAKEPHNRFPSAAALADDLRRFLGHERVGARPVTWRERTWRWCRRNPVLAALTAGVLVMLLVVSVTLWVSALVRQERDHAVAAQERAEKAEREVAIRGHLSRAAAIRTRRQVGQRFECLAELEKALKLDPSPELRDEIRTEAIAALALPDFEVAREWDGPADTSWVTFDGSLKRFVRLMKSGVLEVCRLTDDGEEVLSTIDAWGKPMYRGPWLSDDGRYVLVGSGARKEGGVAQAFRVWRVDGAKPRLVLDRPETVYEFGVAFRRGGKHLAVGHADETVGIYDLETGKRVRKIRLHPDSDPPKDGPRKKYAAHNLAFHPKAEDGRLAVAAGQSVRIFDIDGKAERKPLRHPEGFTWTFSVAWHPDGRRLASACNNTIFLWDTETAALCTPRWVGPTTEGVYLAFNRAGDRVISWDWSGRSRLWDAVTGRLLLTAQGYVGQRFSPDGTLIGPSIKGGKIRLFRVAPGHELRVLRRPGGRPGERTTHPMVDDAGVVAAWSRNRLYFCDLARGEELATVACPWGHGARAVEFHKSRGWLIAVPEAGGKVDLELWPSRADPDQPGLLRIGPPRRVARSMQLNAGISADGRMLAVAMGNEGVVVRDLNRPRVEVPLGPQLDVRHVAISPDGLWVAASSHDASPLHRNVRLWRIRDSQKGEHVHDLPLDSPTHAAFSPDGRLLVTATPASTCKLWEVGTWRELRDFGNVPAVYGAAFCPDGRLALGDSRGTIRLVEAATGKEVACLTFPEPSQYFPGCFSPDGAYLAAMQVDANGIYVWDLRLIRRQLKKMDLDWDAPEFPAAPTAAPLRVIVDQGAANAP
jgi:WD40 repeat protein